MKITSVISIMLLAGLSGFGPAWANESGNDRCRVPDAFARVDSFLPRFAEAIATDQPVKIVILGTASSAGAGVSAPHHSYPERLREELSRRRDQETPISLINLSQRGWTAVEMAAVLDAKVIPLKPTLMIWQTGSVEAVRGLDVNQMGDALSAGVAKLRANDIDVVLISPQYGPQSASMINFAPYAEYMQWIATSLDVNLFNRYEIMRYWFEEKIIQIDETNRATQNLVAIQVHECVAVRLADLIIRAMSLEAPPSESSAR